MWTTSKQLIWKKVKKLRIIQTSPALQLCHGELPASLTTGTEGTSVSSGDEGGDAFRARWLSRLKEETKMTQRDIKQIKLHIRIKKTQSSKVMFIKVESSCLRNHFVCTNSSNSKLHGNDMSVDYRWLVSKWVLILHSNDPAIVPNINDIQKNTTSKYINITTSTSQWLSVTCFLLVTLLYKARPVEIESLPRGKPWKLWLLAMSSSQFAGNKSFPASVLPWQASQLKLETTENLWFMLLSHDKILSHHSLLTMDA